MTNTQKAKITRAVQTLENVLSRKVGECGADCINPSVLISALNAAASTLNQIPRIREPKKKTIVYKCLKYEHKL